MKTLILTFVLVAVPVAAADVPSRVTDVVVAFSELQHVANTYLQLSTCTIPGLPESCTPMLSNANNMMILNEVSGFKVELAKFPTAWHATATEILDRITRQLDPAGATRLAPYLAMVRSVIG